MTRVLRLKAGDRVSMTDGRGTDYLGSVVQSDSGMVEVQILKQESSTTESSLDLIVCSAMLKDKKMDGVIRELTQIGVREWIPFFSSRSIPSPDSKKLTRRVERWQTIARESLKQCRRSREVAISFPCSFEHVLSLASGADHCIAFWEGESRPLVLNAKDRASEAPCVSTLGVRALVLIGPEGGFDLAEIEKARAAGFTSYSLGPRILRAETAAVTAAVLVQYLLGDLGSGRTPS